MRNVSMGIFKIKVCMQKDQHSPEKGYSSPKNYLNYFWPFHNTFLEHFHFCLSFIFCINLHIGTDSLTKPMTLFKKYKNKINLSA